MQIDLINIKGEKVSDLTLCPEVFEGEVKEHLFYEVVKMQLANRRLGTACTKTKGEVSGGGAKPWKQKGTGRARTGSNRNPLWKGGGTIFGPKPRDYSYKVPKKVRKEALRSALRHKVNEGTFKVFDNLNLDSPKTKKALEIFNATGVKSALVVIEPGNNNLKLAVRNIKGFKTVECGGINVFDVLKYDVLVMTKDAFEKVEANLR